MYLLDMLDADLARDVFKPDGTVRKEKRRIQDAYHAHELTFSCFHGLPLLSKDRSRQWFVDALDRARRRHNLELWAYVIMPEHVHVLLRSRAVDYDISLILKSIKLSVS
jgi:putative transposase